MANYSLASPIDIRSSSVTGQLNLFDVGGVDAVQLQAPSLTANVPFYFPATAGTTGQILQQTSSTTTGWVDAGLITAGSLPIELSFVSGTTPSTGFSTASTTPVVICTFTLGLGSVSSGTMDIAVQGSAVGATINARVLSVAGATIVPTTSATLVTTSITATTIAITYPVTPTVCQLSFWTNTPNTITVYSARFN
jgi:hypothetical protein